MHFPKTIRHQRVGFAGVVDDDRQEKGDAGRDAHRALGGEFPFEPKVALVPRLGVGGDDRHQQHALLDLSADLRVPLVAVLDCGHEFLCPFSCKQRGLCASCHQRRTLIEGAFIADEICAPVPHRHLVLTIPRLIRNTFKFNRALLGELHHAARDPKDEFVSMGVLYGLCLHSGLQRPLVPFQGD
ncbi:MAG: hypothetical protein EXS37_08155, partial [Opitutus sp.]|nr:hypothetical protein [Opitutus sp.]